MQSKKVLLVNKFYFPHIGGVETVVQQYAKVLNSDYELVILTCQSARSFLSKEETIDGIKIIRCASLGNLFSMPISISFVLRLIQGLYQYDVLHFHEPFPLASLISVFPKRSKYVVTWHSDIVKQSFFRKIVIPFQKLLLRKADLITTTSPALRENSNVLKFYKEKVVVLPLYISLEEYDNCNIISKPFFNLPSKYFLFLGRFTYYKGISFLIDAYLKAQIDEPLVLAGGGRLSDSDLAKVHSNNSIILINRFLEDEEKKYLLKNCHCYLFPSIHNSEAFGITQLEAMAFSKPVINTNLNTGVPWVSIDKESGITIDVNDHKALANAIIELSDPDLKEYKKYSDGARERVKTKFNEKVVAPELIRIYKKLLNE